MTHSLFNSGGPYNIRRTGSDEYSLSISLPKDSDGRVARECPADACSPGYFKVMTGTGLTDQDQAFCPYCRQGAKPSDFATKSQIKYAQDIALREAHKGMDNMIKNAFGLGSAGKKTYGGGLVSLEVSYKPGTMSLTKMDPPMLT